MGSDKRVRRAATRRVTLLLASAVAATALSAGAALAQGGGGAAAPGDPQIDDVECLTLCVKQRIATDGSRIKITGAELGNTTVVSLLNADGTRSKQNTKKGVVVKSNGQAVWANVQPGVVSGPIRIVDSFAQVRDSKFDLKIGTAEQLEKAQAGFTLPDSRRPRLRRCHGPLRRRPFRTHPPGPGRPRRLRHQAGRRPRRQGPVPRLPVGGRQLPRHRRARSRNDYAYMHLKGRPAIAPGQTVSTGQRVGKVGETGDATGCHLHFELWTEPGWY